MATLKKLENISQKEWDEAEIPEWTDEDFALAKPAKDVLEPAVYDALVRLRGQRGKQKAPVKVAVKLRLDPDVLKAYKTRGRGWQTHMNEVLRKGLNE